MLIGHYEMLAMTLNSLEVEPEHSPGSASRLTDGRRETSSGKRCFITGAASGIGRATALAAARRGADLYLTDIDAEALERAAAEIGRAAARSATPRRSTSATTTASSRWPRRSTPPTAAWTWS